MLTSLDDKAAKLLEGHVNLNVKNQSFIFANVELIV